MGRLGSEPIRFSRRGNHRFTGSMPAWTHFWTVFLLKRSFRIGNEGMVRPATSFSAAVKHTAFGMRSVVESSRSDVSAGVVSFKCMISEFMRHHRRPGLGRATGPTPGRSAVAGLPIGGSRCPSDFPLSHSPFQPLRNAPLSLLSRTPESGLRTLASGPGRSCVAPKRVSHGQQNAYRCVSPRRNQGGRPSR
jgi:hypothetical protein